MNNREHFAVISIKLTNIEAVEKYIEQAVAQKIIQSLIIDLLDRYGKDAVYSSGHDEINLVIEPDCKYVDNCKEILRQYSRPSEIEEYSTRISMKMGIYEYKGSKETPIDVYNKSRIAYEQGSEYESGIYHYDKQLELKRKETLEITTSLVESIKKKELYLVYQPKINIADDSIAGVEVLIRWNRGYKKPVGPDVFIKLAEDIGFIKEISTFVFENTCRQVVKWRQKGIDLNFSMNFTDNELLDSSFVEMGNQIIDKCSIDRTAVEIEITERVISKSDKIRDVISEFRAKGFKISIDDFGTGVNSLLRMAGFPFDIIKIDKYFIHRIDNVEIKALISTITNYAHS
jgi:EAL domain-containing protein (putative c-di-GMP-specific phosphodiesterase class I)